MGGRTQDELDAAVEHYSASTSIKFLFAFSLSFYLIDPLTAKALQTIADMKTIVKVDFMFCNFIIL